MTAIAQSPTVNRPTTITAATVMLALFGTVGIVASPFIGEGGDIPFVAIGVVTGLLRIVAAVGVWRLLRWSAILGFVVSLLDALLAAPGLFFAPDATSRTLATIGVVLGITTLVLLVLPTSRRAYV